MIASCPWCSGAMVWTIISNVVYECCDVECDPWMDYASQLELLPEDRVHNLVRGDGADVGPRASIEENHVSEGDSSLPWE